MYKIHPPDDAEIIDGSLSYFWFDPEGILYSRSRNIVRTIELMRENFDLVKKITGNKRVCIISEATDLPPIARETADYMADEIPLHFKAMAVISNSDMGKLASDIYFQLHSHPIPTQTFDDLTEAREWIRQYLVE